MGFLFLGIVAASTKTFKFSTFFFVKLLSSQAEHYPIECASHWLVCLKYTLTIALIAALICSGSPGQTAMISARSEGSSEVCILACFWDLGVNWVVNCSFGASQAFVLSAFTFLLQRTENPCVGGSASAL